MSLRESLLRALASLSAHKLRSVLTMLGMIFGVGAVIAMLSIGAGAERQALEMIRRMGISNVIVRAKEFRPDELQEVRKKSIGVSLRDAAGIEEAVPGVDFTGPRVTVNPWSVRGRGGKSEARVSGVSWRHAELVSLPLAAGRFLTKEDEEAHAQVCVLGDGARRDLFGWEPALGRTVKVNDVWLTVVG
nr:ABC transporter permease [Thermoanaerobaculia bacterium]